MKYKILSLLFIFLSSLSAQINKTLLFIEHHSLLNDTSQVEIVSYKIPYSSLVFQKENGKYKCSASISFEIYNDKKFIEREFQSFDVFTSNYEETKSNGKYFQGLIQFATKPGEYQLKTNLNVKSINTPIKPIESKLIIDTLSSTHILNPFIINHTNGTFSKFKLANFGHKIPFSPGQYDILIGFIDTSITEIHFSVTQLNKIVFSDSLTKLSTGKIRILKQNGNIILNIDTSSSHANIFRLTNFSNQLLEGKAELIIDYADTTKKFPLNVVWFNKPKVLSNPEYAIKLLSYIEDKKVVSSLLRSGEEHYLKNLLNYWIEHYPADGMKYNFAMNEYYSRADYAIENFSSLAGLDGAETDRGRTYIVYGKPSSIDRNYSEKNDIIEVWRYDKIGKSFVFKDVNGTGEFNLVE